MSKKDEALKLALEALEAIAWSNNTTWQSQRAKIEVDAIREALAEQDSKDKEQSKTDAFVKQLDEALTQPYPDNFIDALKYDVAKRDSEAQQQEPVGCANGCRGFFKHHQPAQRKPLTMQERTSIVRANTSFHDKNGIDAYGIIDDVEAAHGITGEQHG